MRLKRDFFVFGEAVTKSNNTCQYVKGVVLGYVDGDATERKSSLQETHFGEANKKQHFNGVEGFERVVRMYV